MTARNYTVSILVDRSPAEVFQAINNVRAWWAGEIEGKTDTLGASFTYRYKHFHRSTHKITEMTPGKKVVWRTTDASINFVADKSEWNGTDIVFEITGKDGKTELRFTHVGLSPSIECYADCSDAWGSLIKGSLRELIEKSPRKPNKAA